MRAPPWILAILLLLAGAPAQAMIPALPLTEGRTVQWLHSASAAPVRYRSGDLLITIRGTRAGGDEAMVGAEVSVGQVRPVMQGPQPPALPIQMIRSGPTPPFSEHGLSVGRLDRSGARFVMWQAYTGGAHCCFDIQLILPDSAQRGIVRLGAFDMEMMADAPGDVDGDGRTDFVLRDDAFLYAFASFAASFAPPQIWNVEEGRAVNVSAAARYRALFAEAIEETRPICLDPRGGADRNGACAAFVAASARTGDFEGAWRAMLGGYDRGGDGHRDGAFPDRLRAFLRDHGYLPGRLPRASIPPPGGGKR